MNTVLRSGADLKTATVLARHSPASLASHPEPGQTFGQHLACRPTRARGARNELYVVRWGDRQMLTTCILDAVLRPRVPAASIAFTCSDLWPGEGWNFVFGQATLRHRVAVWSVHRFGDPDAGEESFAKCLLRTMKIATHETGHMFSMLRCTAYECNVCGSNHLEEADRQQPWLCTGCMPKVSAAAPGQAPSRLKS